MKPFSLPILIIAPCLLCACNPRYDKDPDFTYQSRQDAFFDGCKSGHDCAHPLNDPALHPKVAVQEEDMN